MNPACLGLCANRNCWSINSTWNISISNNENNSYMELDADSASWQFNITEAGGAAPTGVLHGSLVGPLGGPI